MAEIKTDIDINLYILYNGDMDTNEKMIGYCVKCKEKREMNDVEHVEIKPGRPAAKGKCSVCNTGMYKILPGVKKTA